MTSHAITPGMVIFAGTDVLASLTFWLSSRPAFWPFTRILGFSKPSLWFRAVRDGNQNSKAPIPKSELQRHA